VVIAGKPNVGKSSLLNALLKSDRAIVTPIPGTTRDLIEEKVVINGIPVRLVDTAGLHPTGDEVEALGVARAEDLIARADLVLFMIDGHHGVDERDCAVYVQLQEQPFILVRNKYDLYEAGEAVQIPDEWTHVPIIDISATEAIGLERLSAAIVEKVVQDRPLSLNESPLVPNLRQKRHIRQAVDAIIAAQKEFEAAGRLELVAESMNTARSHLIQIVGQVPDDALLDEVFGQFCIGK
jgi:tRNA modification GTPase